jgi:hypothetical protein
MQSAQWLLWTVPMAGLPLLAALLFNGKGMEAKLAEAAGGSLSTAKVTWASITFHGRDAHIEGGPHCDQPSPPNQQQSSRNQGQLARDLCQVALGERRAVAAAHALGEAGVDASRLSAVGYGETVPLAKNWTDEGRVQNRRIEIIVK